MSSLFMRRPENPDIVEAEQVGAGAQSHPQGSRPARPGDWVVTNHATGETRTLTNEEFTVQYAPLAIPAHMDPTSSPPTSPSDEPDESSQPMNDALEDRPSTAPTQTRLTEPGTVEADDKALATEPEVTPATP